MKISKTIKEKTNIKSIINNGLDKLMKKIKGVKDPKTNPETYPTKKKLHMNEDDQGQGSQGRHFFPTHGSGRSQIREQYENYPTKTANSPSPLYDYVREQAMSARGEAI